MKLISFNVNGIRAALKKGLREWLEEENPDIVSLQEIKLSEVELVEESFTSLGYNCYWYPAQKKGYSGVSIFSKKEPKSIRYGFGIQLFDDEGRVIIAEYDSFKLICAYFPSGSSGDIRQEIKMQFLADFTEFVKSNGSDNLIICGDVNICKEAIDIHNPKSNKNTSGFLPEERAWFKDFIDLGFVDIYREFDKEPHNYSWWSYRANARAKNLGWRIDYFLVSENLKDKITSARILPEINMSDHCPILIEING